MADARKCRQESRHWAVAHVQAVQASASAAGGSWHMHEHHIFCLVDHGRRRVELSSGALEAEAGAALVIPARTVHRCLDAEEASYRILSLAPSLVRELWPQSGKICAARWNRLFEEAFSAVASGLQPSLEELFPLTVQLVGAGQSPVLHGACRYIRKVDQELQRDLTERKTLSELARQIGVSSYHLQHLYVRAKGLSPQRQRLMLQLRRARSLLLGGAPLSEAAQASGFADQSHLTRAFRDWMGVSPGRYRSQFRQSSKKAHASGDSAS